MAQLSFFPEPTDEADVLPETALTRCKKGDLWTLGQHRLLVGDCTVVANVARLMDGEQASLLFCDPPYGLHLDTWDVSIIDAPAWLSKVIPYLTTQGFFVLCHQFPLALQWMNALEASELRCKDHVVWVKRMATTAALPLNRAHESLFVYGTQKSRYIETKGRYTDVKLPGVLVDTMSLEGIDRYIKSLEAKVYGRKEEKYDSKVNRHQSYRYMAISSDRSPEIVNFTNVWSFLPANSRKDSAQSTGHPTCKPLALVERAIGLCTEQDAIVCDPFCGSGTAIIACERVKRRCYACEISPHYADIIIARWERLTRQTAVLLE